MLIFYNAEFSDQTEMTEMQWHCSYYYHYLSGSASTMPMTMIFLPGLIPPLIRPLKGTVCEIKIKAD